MGIACAFPGAPFRVSLCLGEEEERQEQRRRRREEGEQFRSAIMLCLHGEHFVKSHAEEDLNVVPQLGGEEDQYSCYDDVFLTTLEEDISI